MKILVVDDERAVRESLRRALELEGYEIELAEDGAQALERLEAEPEPDAMVLDVLMPGVDGLEVSRTLRRKGSKVPILMLTARTQVEDRVEGLDAGADDYLTKPFALEELLARVRALLRRTGDGTGETLRFADLELDPGTREVTRGGERIELTRTEFSLLELFLLNPRQVLTRSLIFERVWGYDFGFASNSLDVYIGYLRRKTEAGGKPRLIHTVRGVGYALREAMSFRTRLALVAAAAVGIAVVAASVTVFIVVHNELFGEVDRALYQRAGGDHEPVRSGVDEGHLHVPGPPVGVQSDFVQAVPFSGPPFVEPGAGFRLPVTGKDRRGGARRAAALLRQPELPGHRVPGADDSRHALRAADRAAALRGEPDAAPDHALPDPDRGRRDGRCGSARPAGRAHGAGAGPAADRDHRGRHRDARPLAADRVDLDRRRRARPARLELQHDARGARGLQPRAAAARRRRLARAAHAAHQPEDEHRGPRARERVVARVARAPARATSSSRSTR